MCYNKEFGQITVVLKLQRVQIGYQNSIKKYFETLFLCISHSLFTALYVFYGCGSVATLKWRSLSTPLTLMMCLSDANEWFLRSSVSPPLLPFHFFSPSGFFICQKAMRKEFFSFLWLWNSLSVVWRKKKTSGWIMFFMEIELISDFHWPDSCFINLFCHVDRRLPFCVT